MANVLEGNSRNAQATVRVQTSNSIKLVLTGRPSAKVFILIAYDPRSPNDSQTVDVRISIRLTTGVQPILIAEDSYAADPFTVHGG